MRNARFWTQRYLDNQTGWDLGEASPALIEYCQPLDRDTHILIPGAGNAYEWKALKALGFTQVTVLDISPIPVQRLSQEFPDHADQLVIGDFFAHEGSYDLILEQTFFCAIDPELRPDYVRKAHALLKKGGQLVGLLFDRTFEGEGPPNGGSRAEYMDLMLSEFEEVRMEPCLNSVAPRAGSELFFVATSRS